MPTPATTSAPLRRGGHSAGRRGTGRRGAADKPRSEFDHKVISVRRVARVVAGGRRFSFSVVVVIGNRKGKVGVGLGKAGDTTLAIDKAMNAAKKGLLILPLTETNSIPHQIEAKFGSSRIEIRPAPGKGLVAGSAVRTVLDLAGVRDITAKVHSRSKNKLNIARAAILALAKLKA